MFAGGTMTDIILTGVGTANRYDKASEAMVGAQGLVIPLENYIDTISVGYKAALDEMDGMRDYITTPDGHIYSLPNVDGSLHVQSVSYTHLDVYKRQGYGNGLNVDYTWPESDLQMMELTIPDYIDQEPFHTYYLTVSGHQLWNFIGNMMSRKHQDLVEDLP